MVQILPSVKMLLISLLQKAGDLLRLIPLPHKHILLMHDGIVRQQLNGRRERPHQRIVLLFIAAESRRQLKLPAHANVTSLGQDDPVPAVHHGEIVPDIYLLHTLLLTRMNFGRRNPAIFLESAFSPNFC